MKARTFGRWVAYAVWVGLAIEMLVVWIACLGDADAYSRSWALTRVLGWNALLALCAALCVTPIARASRRFVVTQRGWARELRRGLGLFAASAALVHAALAWSAVPGTRATLFDTAQLRAGLACLLILTLLYLTSFRSNVRRLRLGFWKELHRLAYVAWAFAILHALYGAFAPLRALLLLSSLTLVIGLLRFVPAKQTEHSGPL